MSDYNAPVQCHVLDINADFDMILGCNWMKENCCDLLLTKDCAKLDCAQHDDIQYVWPIAAGSQDCVVRLSMIEAADLESC